MNQYQTICARLREEPRSWLVTGAAGFIGSAIVERLLELGQRVTGLDNFVTGHRSNVEDVLQRTGRRDLLVFVEGDIRDLWTVNTLVEGVDYILHQAALGSVPRSIESPLESHMTNVDGFLNVLESARSHGIERMVYASSSSVYGDDPVLPKLEQQLGEPLSPYALTKRIDELYARLYASVYDTDTVGLRYFNVYGPRQDPQGPYAAVIPRWIERLVKGEPCVVFGDGQASRDFTYVADVVQANILAATAPRVAANHVYNIARGERTTLLTLHQKMREQVGELRPLGPEVRLVHDEPRPGDVAHSHADTSRARAELGFEPGYSLGAGLQHTVEWFVARGERHVGDGAHASPRTGPIMGL